MIARRLAPLSLLAVVAALLLWWWLDDATPAPALPETGPDASTRTPVERGRLHGERESVPDPLRQDADGEADAATATARGSLRVVVCGTDGEPARNLAFELFRADGTSERRSHRRAATDATGQRTLAELAIGTWHVLVAGHTSGVVEVRAGELAEITLRVPLQGTVTVRCVDVSGVAVVDAEVLLWPASNTTEPQRFAPGTAIGRAGRDGTLTLSHVPGRYRTPCWVQARAPGLGASLARAVPIVDDQRREVVLTIARDRAVATVRVRGADGQPVAGARVLVQPIDAPAMRSDDQGPCSAYVVIAATTDARGVAEILPLPAGNHEVRVAANGHADGHQRFESDGLRPRAIVVTLAEPAAIAGVVRAERGRPVAGASVRIAGEVVKRSTKTRADGRFDFDDLPAGSYDWSVRHDAHAPATGAVDAAANATARLAVTIESLANLVGSVVDAQGRALPGFHVLLRHQLPGFGVDRREAIAGDDGRFTVRAQRERVYELRLREPDRYQQIALPGHDDVRATDAPLRLVVPDGLRASAFVALRLLDAAARPALAGVAVSALGDGRPLHAGSTLAVAERDDVAGTIRIGPLLAGRYTLRFRRADRFQFDSATIELEAGRTRELGDLAWPEHGALAVIAERLPGVPPGDVLLEVTGPRRVGMQLDPANLTGELPLEPGTWTATVYGGAFVTRRRQLTIVAGDTSEWRCVLQPAVRVPFRVHAPADERSLRCELHGPDGTALFDFELEPGQRHDDWAPHLGIGRHRFVAVGASGRRYAAELVIESLAPSAARRDVRLVEQR